MEMSKRVILGYVLARLDMDLCGEIKRKAHNLDGKKCSFCAIPLWGRGGGGSGGDGALSPNNSEKRRKSNVDK